MPEIRQAEPLSIPDTAALRYLPEGPIPLDESLLSWVGIQHGSDATSGSLNRLNLSTLENESFDLPGRPGFAFPCTTEGKFVIGCERSLGIFDVQSKQWSTFCEGVDDDVDNTIINDGIVYQDNLIFGTKDLEFATKKAGLYLYRGSDQQLIRLRDDQICSNGKAMLVGSGDAPQLVDIDSPTRQIVRYPIDIAAGKLGEPTVLLDFAGEPGVPDGAILTPDNKAVIVAFFRPEVADFGETRMYDLDSKELLCTWQTPGSPQNTCPALVRHAGALKLVITTAVEHMSDEAQQQCPNAGRIFLADTDIADDQQPLTTKWKH